MSLCLNCGAENDPGLDTCIVCGSKLENDLDQNFVPFNQPEAPAVEPVAEEVPTYEPEMPVLQPEESAAPVQPVVPTYENTEFVAPVEPVIPSYEQESPIIEDPVFEQPAYTDSIADGIPFDQFVPTETVTPISPVVPTMEPDIPADTPNFGNGFTSDQSQANFVPVAAPIAPTAAESEKPLTVGGFLFTFIMSIIPVVNLIALISWACGASKNKNRINFSRAAIIAGIVVFAILIALFMTDVLKFSYIADFINGIFGQKIL